MPGLNSTECELTKEEKRDWEELKRYVVLRNNKLSRFTEY